MMPEIDDRKIFMDSFVKVCLIAFLIFEVAIFASATYMNIHKMVGTGTDDLVNDAGATATSGSATTHHPFINLPGDTQLGAFSIANFFVGLMVGYTWRKIYFDTKKEDVESQWKKSGSGGPDRLPSPGGVKA